MSDLRAKTPKVGVLVVALVAALLAPLTGPAAPADAVTAADWDPGMIISDAKFYDGAAMTQDEIQQFLQAKVGTCGNSNCLANYRTDTTTRTWTWGNCRTYPGEAGESAARIIFKVQQACGLSAKAILVTLQKEQGLITSRSPSDSTMRIAMGFACPDTAPCDAAYYGFFNQVVSAGRQLTWYGEGSFTWYQVGAASAIKYNPNAACGSASVFIKNRATAALYYYTPYTPNAAALANLGGVGDACSSYGNRNFWAYYNNWFGPSVGPDPAAAIAAEYTSQGGASGPLGAPASEVLAITENGGGYGRAFTGGSVYWTARYGAVTVLAGKVLSYYFARGGAAGPLGWPQFDTAVVDASQNGIAQAFVGGSVYSSNAGTFSVPEALRSSYFARGGSLGTLGWPTGEASVHTAGTGGIEQPFQTGQLMRSPAGDYVVPTGIYAALVSAGGADGAIGWPTSGLIPIPQVNGGGSGQVFQGGSIFASADGAFAVSGAIRTSYFAGGGAAGRLGWPVAAASCADGSCRQDFQYGSILTGSAGTTIDSPQIQAVYTQLGGAAGKLGNPASGLLRLDMAGGGVAVAYAGGSIYYKRAYVAAAVTQPILQRYFGANGAAGRFGWPTTVEQCVAGEAFCSQTFEGGTLFRSFDDVARLSTADIYAVYGQLGGARGALGPSVTDLIAIAQNGGGVAQAFRSGSIYSKPSVGTFAVSGPVRDRYFQLGGAAGALGWPKGANTCAGGTCTQTFEGGTIAVSG